MLCRNGIGSGYGAGSAVATRITTSQNSPLRNSAQNQALGLIFLLSCFALRACGEDRCE